MTAYTGTNLLGTSRWAAGQEFTAVGKYSLTGSVVTGDTFTWSDLIPAGGVQILSVHWQSVELDTNATPTATLIVGTEDDDNGLIKSFIPGVNTTGNTQINAVGNGDLISTTVTSAKDVIATLGGTVATAQSSGDLYVFVRYYCVGLS